MTAPRVRILDLASKIPRPSEGLRLAAIDIGSNSIRQIVADVSPSGNIRIIDEMKAAPRLGAGLARAGKLSAASIRLTEEFLGERPKAKHLKKLRSRVREGIRRALPVRDWRGALLIGSGGTFTNLGAMHLAARGLPYDGRVHGTLVQREEIEHLLDTLLASSRQERAAIPGLNPDRGDIILAGLAVAAEVMARIEVREMTVSGYGIREGLLLESARVAATPAVPGEARERSVRSFAAKCHFEQPHAEHVQRLALQLFDALGRRLDLDQSDRAILSDAALLHDVGYHIGHARHHKHTFHLISHAELLGVSPEEQMLISHVARYHRGAEPKRTHREFGQLERGNRRRIRRLAAILRLADGLDRGHAGAVRQVKVRWLERALRVTLVPHTRATSVRLEVWGGSRKSGLLEKVIGRAVELVSLDGTVLDPGPEGRSDS